MRTLALSAVVMASSQVALPAQASHGLVHTAEVDLAYETLGTDHTLPPVFAVNGGPGLTHAYMVQNDLWNKVANRRMVVFYDQRGNGQSVRMTANAPQNLEAQVADLDAVRAALHAEKVDLVGDSYGGFLVLAYTLAHPDHVRRLVVSDGLPGWGVIVHPMSDIFPDLEAKTEARLKDLHKGAEADEYSFRAHLRKCFVSPEIAARYLSHFHDLGLNSAIGAQVEAAAHGIDLSPELGTIHVSTLILTGRYDVNVAPLTAWRMAKAIPNAKFRAFEQSGHLPSYEEPEAYLKVLSDFLNR